MLPAASRLPRSTCSSSTPPEASSALQGWGQADRGAGQGDRWVGGQVDMWTGGCVDR